MSNRRMALHFIAGSVYVALLVFLPSYLEAETRPPGASSPGVAGGLTMADTHRDED